MLLSEAVPALLFMLLLTMVPDTPRWLVMKGRSNQALQILDRLSGPEEARKTVAEIEDSLQVEGSSTKASLFAFGSLVLWVGILLSVFQQLVGINAVLYYAPQMFENMGASTNASFLQTVVVGAANVLFTVVAILTVDRLGRRPLMIAGALVMAVAMIALGFLFYANSVGVMALGAVLLYIAGFALSWGPVTWVLLSEIFPNAIKNQAMAIAVAAQWIANLVISISFPVVDGASSLNALFHHGFAYWIYGAMSLLAAAFVYWYVPETKQKTLEEIQALWTRSSPAAAGAAGQEQLIEHAGHPRRT
jgi:SP family xylose:H+ symportor-like MFS transporter